MLVLRNRPKGARFASFGLGLCIFALMPTEIGYQDIASLLARQPGVAERWQKRVFSAAATIQLATYSFGRPIGTSTPQSATYRLASLDNQGIDITGSMHAQSDRAAAAALSGLRFPQGRSHAEGRSPRRPRRAARDAAPPADADARRSRDLQCLGDGRQDRQRCAGGRAARRSIRNLQEALNAPPLAAIRHLAVARGPAARRR